MYIDDLPVEILEIVLGFVGVIVYYFYFEKYNSCSK